MKWLRDSANTRSADFGRMKILDQHGRISAALCPKLYAAQHCSVGFVTLSTLWKPSRVGHRTDRVLAINDLKRDDQNHGSKKLPFTRDRNRI